MARPARDEGSLIVLAETIERFIEMKFCDATCNLHCLADLIACNPAFRREVAAMRRISRDRGILIALTNEAKSL